MANKDSFIQVSKNRREKFVKFNDKKEAEVIVHYSHEYHINKDCLLTYLL